MPSHDLILIVDFGSQVTQLIARRLRERHFYCEIHPYHAVDPGVVRKLEPKGIILSGGPRSVLEDDAPTISSEIFELNIPIFGICFGQQLMVKILGGAVEMGDSSGIGGEFGKAFIEEVAGSPIFEGIFTAQERHEQVWMSHGDHVASLPEGFKSIAKSSGAPFAAIEYRELGFYGVQFHPEVIHTPNGTKILNNFCKNIANATPNWTMKNYKNESITYLRKKIGKSSVICGLSGGVDSAVTAVLLHEAIGDQLTCVFVDTGLLRADEASQVERLFKDHYQIDLRVVHAEDIFLGNLTGIDDPEKKRKIIGKTFIDIFDEHATPLKADFLAQGTLYPDVIESVSPHGGPSQVIKSHHNVGGLPEKMSLKLVEPLRELFKDEVRALGRELGLPSAFVQRHPFPGPGLAIRIPGAVTKEKADILRKADKIYLEEIEKVGLYDEIWQAFAVLLPVKTVGVMGDARTYDYVCGLRAVTSTDGMTAECYPFEMGFLTHVSSRIVNEVRGINRVVYDVTSKPPGTIEWE